MSATSVLTGPWQPVGADRHELGEGARWVGDRFVAVDLLAGTLLGVDGDTLRPELSLDVPLGAVAPRTGGGWIGAAGTGIVLVDPDGTTSWPARPEDDAATPMRMNDGVADPHGRFWAGSMALDASPGAGSLYRVDPDLTVTRVLGDLSVPNGPAFDATGTVMYLADSTRGVIRRYPVDAASGVLGDPTTFARFDGVNPDGMVVDAEDHLWTALWGGSRLHRYRPDGHLAEAVPVPARQPTSVALSTTGPATVLVSTATHGLSPTDHDGRFLRAPVAVGGLPVCRFDG